MIRLLIAGRRAAGITRRAAHAHLRDAHGRLVLDKPADAGAPLAAYAQNHVVDGIYGATRGEAAVERDLLTELCFDDIDEMRAGMASAYYREVLGPDEKRFVDGAGAAAMMVDSRVVAAGPRAEHKAFLLLGRAASGDERAWRDAVAAATEVLADAVAVSEHAVRAAPDGRRFVDVIVEGWFASREAAAAAIERVAPMLAGAAFDRDRSLLLLAEEYGEARLRALYAATGNAA